MPKKKGSKLLGLDDERFAHLRSDPKFSGLSNKDKKVTIGKRFAAVVTDPRFSSKARVDKYGRPVKKTSDDLLDLYELESSEEEGEKEEGTPAKKIKVEKKARGRRNELEEKDVSDEHYDEEEQSGSSDDRPVKIDLARGEGNVESSSDDDDSDSESEWQANEDLQMEIDLAHLDEDAEQVEWATNRIAACNMDWNVVHCEDLMVLAKSFTPPGGSIKRITIYLSDFGAERLAEEDKHGPRLQLSKPLEEYEGDKIDDETKLAMRKYQVDQLRYYYAIIECDSTETAVAIYDQCDGFQFEASNIKMDLRFVPEDMEFDAIVFQKDRIKEELCEDDLNVAKYKSKEKLKSAVAQTSARIGWDETEQLRQKKFEEAFNSDEEAGADLIADSESDDEEHEKNRQALLSLLDNKEEVDGLQVDWDNRRVNGESDDDEEENEDEHRDENEESDENNPAKESANPKASDQNEEEEEIDLKKIGAKKKQSCIHNYKRFLFPSYAWFGKEKNTYQAYMERRKQKKAERKQRIKELKEKERDALKTIEDQAKARQKENRAALRAAKHKEEKEGALAEAVAGDERFKALFTDSAFAIDQSSKNFKSSKLIEKQVAAKRKASEQVQKTSSNSETDLLSKLKQKSAKWKGQK
ncbi:NUC153 domain protein [Ancylostoma caninum]|uniref:NUC153 domain protein n=1 Tax=Ancylostoma caninum TaxID=29170 RepID=A0A368GYI9_ANCCA|nr:NUC153 domain protein [Ancylostoma caninum]